MNTKEKKPVFKKTWFWVIIVIIVIGAYSASQQNKATVVNSNNNNATSENKPSEKTTFKVGETIAFDGKEVTIKSIDQSLTNQIANCLSIRLIGKLRMQTVPLKDQVAQLSRQAIVWDLVI